jgi:hypothetical protein
MVVVFIQIVFETKQRCRISGFLLPYVKKCFLPGARFYTRQTLLSEVRQANPANQS